jgi:NAD(P)-dependent dehydrogenase (short-subunit alcohol dehydrogenase family)
MTARRALVLGGTGMLAGCVGSLVHDGWHVVVPSRRYAPIPAAPEEAQPQPDDAGERRRALWVQADWSEPDELVARAAKALGGAADLLVAWVHESARPSVLRAVAPLLAPGAPVVEVHGSASANPVGGCPDPVLDDHPTQQVVLGFVSDGGRTRWLTHHEIVDGVLDAVRRALDGRPPIVHQVGEFRPTLS